MCYEYPKLSILYIYFLYSFDHSKNKVLNQKKKKSISLIGIPGANTFYPLFAKPRRVFDSRREVFLLQEVGQNSSLKLRPAFLGMVYSDRKVKRNRGHWGNKWYTCDTQICGIKYQSPPNVKWLYFSLKSFYLVRMRKERYF